MGRSGMFTDLLHMGGAEILPRTDPIVAWTHRYANREHGTPGLLLDLIALTDATSMFYFGRPYKNAYMNSDLSVFGCSPIPWWDRVEWGFMQVHKTTPWWY